MPFAASAAPTDSGAFPVAPKRIAQRSVGLALRFGGRLRRQHLQLDDLVARRGARQAAAAQPQLAAGLRVRGDLQLDRPAQGRHADRRAQRRLPGRHRQHVDDVAAVHLELRVRGILDLQVQVPALRALPRQPDRLARAHALGHAHLQGLAVDADAHAVAVVDRLQRDRQSRAGVARGLRAARPATEAAGRAAPAPEQFLEEVTEAAARAASGEDLVEVEAFRSAAMPEPAGRWPDLVAGAVAARAQLVVGLALGRVAQRLVGLVDLLEALLGVRLLADVGVVLARQPAIGGLDLRLAGTRLDAQDRVVVLELHGSPVPLPGSLGHYRSLAAGGW